MAETYSISPGIKTLMGNLWWLTPPTSILFVQPSERYTLSDCMSWVHAKALHCRAGLGGRLHCGQTRVLCVFNGRNSKRRLSRFSEPSSEHLRIQSLCQNPSEGWKYSSLLSTSAQICKYVVSVSLGSQICPCLTPILSIVCFRWCFTM